MSIQNTLLYAPPKIYFDENGEFRREHGGFEPTIKAFIKCSPHCPLPLYMIRCEAYMKVGGYTKSNKLLMVEGYRLWMNMYTEGYRGVQSNLRSVCML